MRTPGPWLYQKTTLGHLDNALYGIIRGGSCYIARPFHPNGPPGVNSGAPETYEEAEDNAAYIVASVNACDFAGLTVKALEGGVVKEAFEAIRALVGFAHKLMCDGRSSPECPGCRGEAVLDKLETE